MIYEVYVRGENYYEESRCDWLGHHSYRCGKCRKGYIKVRNEDDHDAECPECKRKVVVRRGKDLW